MAEEDKTAFSEEQVQGIKQIVSQIVNSAIATRDKMSDKKREQDREALKADFAKLLEEKLAKPADPKDDPDGKGGKPRDRKEDVEIQTMKRRMEQLEKTTQEAMQQAAAERAKNRNAAKRDAVAEILEPLGITGARFKYAYAALQDRLNYAAEDSDDLVFSEDTGGEVDYRAGLTAWAKSDEAKILLPPTGTQGAGTRPRSGNPQVKSGPVTAQERNQKMLSVLGEWGENPR